MTTDAANEDMNATPLSKLGPAPAAALGPSMQSRIDSPSPPTPSYHDMLNEMNVQLQSPPQHQMQTPHQHQPQQPAYAQPPSALPPVASMHHLPQQQQPQDAYYYAAQPQMHAHSHNMQQPDQRQHEYQHTRPEKGRPVPLWQDRRLLLLAALIFVAMYYASPRLQSVAPSLTSPLTGRLTLPGTALVAGVTSLAFVKAQDYM